MRVLERIRELFRTRPLLGWGLVLLIGLGLGYVELRSFAPPTPRGVKVPQPTKQVSPAAPPSSGEAKKPAIPSLQGAGRADPFQPLVVGKPAEPRQPARRALPSTPEVPPLPVPLPPPFPPPTVSPAPAPAPPPVEKPAAPALALTGIITNKQPLAILRAGSMTSIVAEGEEASPGVKVIRIQADSGRVIVAVNGQTVELRMGGD